MNFITQQGRALLLAVMVAVGACCLVGCERLTDAKRRSEAAEAGRVLKSYESAVLAAVVEKGDNFTKKDLGFEPRKDSKYFTYTVSEDGASCTATARIDIGDFKKGSAITIKYDKVKEDFVYSSSQRDAAEKLFPISFVNGNENAAPSNQQSGGGSGGSNTLTDSRNGKTYKTVVIGDKRWMGENLNYQTGNSWCYNDDNSKCKQYGRLYDWNTAITACPKGWHLPTSEEWDNMQKAAGKDFEGKTLKSVTGWEDNGNGTDAFGFSALPGGCRDEYDGSFSNAGSIGFWWLANDLGTNAGSDFISSDGSFTRDCVNVKGSGYSVRCIAD